MKALSRNQILELEDLKPQRLEVPEWGGCVYIQPLSARQRDRLEKIEMSEDIEDFMAKVAVMSVVDAKGEHLFAENDCEALANKSAAAILRIFAKVKEVNSVTNEDVEDQAKN